MVGRAMRRKAKWSKTKTQELIIKSSSQLSNTSSMQITSTNPQNNRPRPHFNPSKPNNPFPKFPIVWINGAPRIVSDVPEELVDVEFPLAAPALVTQENKPAELLSNVYNKMEIQRTACRTTRRHAHIIERRRPRADLAQRKYFPVGDGVGITAVGILLGYQYFILSSIPTKALAIEMRDRQSPQPLSIS